MKKGQYVKADYGCLLVHADEVDLSKPNQYGFFEVGKDLPAGEYRMETLTSQYSSELETSWGISGAYQVFSSKRFGTTVEKGGLVAGQEYITLSKGQCLAIVNVKLTLIN